MFITNLKIFDKKIFIFLVFFTFNLIYILFFTPNDSIIFYDIDSRRNIDEIIQILQPTNFYDFVYDAAFGGIYTYGRIFHASYSLLVLITKPLLINIFTIPQLVMILNFNFLLCSTLMLYTFYKNKIFGFSMLCVFLTFQFSSILTSETTSFEIFIASFCFYLLNKKNISKENQKRIVFLVFGILAGIKFPNIIFYVFSIAFLSNNSIKKIFYSLIFFIIGLVIAQPMILTPKGIKYYYENIFHHLVNYKESTVNRIDWFNLVTQEYGGYFYILFLVFGVAVFYLNKDKFSTFFLIFYFSSIAQLILQTFSSGVIRAHHIKLPIFFLFFLTGMIVEIKIKNFLNLFIIINVVFFLTSSFDIYQSTEKFNYVNLKTFKISSEYEKFEEVKQMRMAESVVIDLSNRLDIKSIWWDQNTKYYPYPEFHWTSTENKEDSKYFIREMWGDQYKFIQDNCIDNGGILVFINDEIFIDKELEELEFNFYKKIQKGVNNQYYFIYYKHEEGLPLNC